MHVHLENSGFWDDRSIFRRYNNNTNPFFTPEFFAVLNNTLAHFKMLPKFMEMGFSVDDFLSQTPKDYFLQNMLGQIATIKILSSSGVADPVEQASSIILLYSNLLLIDEISKYPTANGLNTGPLKADLEDVDKELCENYRELLQGWVAAETFDNFTFISHLDKLLKHLGKC